ncbi:SWIM zinc finger family protein [Bacteroides sp. UBA939]|uniref:SWIM zinc finger family protein n=1 Tax=Bacteroides sp. UBA939 TaxID=1946092 RepID=UPI0025BE0EBF|nr:SWIM zinc finger family protein [Bacteroides sp. UBA939]
MLLNLTEEQISQLAPDAASVKAGKGLASQTKWVLLEHNDRAVWGHCQGSGKTPYQTVVDTKDIAFKCSCPSRKFPCKHGLGLLFMCIAHAGLFKEAEEPEWVTAWLSKREVKAEKKEQKEKASAPVDEAAQAKRQAVRHQKVLGGIDDLQIWMKDLLRNGLLNVPERAYTLFEAISRRMVDAQAGGLAGRLRSLQEINYYADSWKYELTDKLGKLYLLAESYKNLEHLSTDWQAEVRTQIGYSQAKEEVMSGEPVSDQWLALPIRNRKVNDLRVDAFWLYGKSSRRSGIYLSFMAPGALPEFNLVPGGVYQGDTYFYQGTGILRILPKNLQWTDATFSPSFSPDLSVAVQYYRSVMQTNPLTEEVPLLVDNVRLLGNGNTFYIQDTAERAIPVHIEESARIDILAITGGKPFSAFLLANATFWELKTIWYQTEFYFWNNEPD